MTHDSLPDFDAVAESRKWKEAVARETEGMTAAERTAYFRSHSSVAAIRESAKQKNPPEKSFVLREEPPKPQSSRE
ncbi:MAG: hypothetical protein U0984_01800 [Prosthecobacter sp.]|nr:hypothetical protein [Prosthecobacter sp.]